MHSDKDTITMTYSSLLQKDGKKAICVRFERKTEQENNYAEAILPDHQIKKQSGFTQDEIIQLVPELEFVYDESLAYADNIERIIKKINSEK
jgi:ribosome-binding factor A